MLVKNKKLLKEKQYKSQFFAQKEFFWNKDYDPVVQKVKELLKLK